MPQGSTRIVSGKVELFDGVIQMVHPEFIVPEEEAGDIPLFEPVYPLTAGITQKTMFKATRSALSRAPDLNEWIDPAQLAHAAWPGFVQAMQSVHTPGGPEDLAFSSPARTRLAYDELMAHQLTLALARASERRVRGRATVGDGRLRGRVRAQLPYAPTDAQDRAISEKILFIYLVFKS